MAYVPGFRNDVFISYAHGDDEPPVSADGKGWVAHLRDRLHAAVRLRLGFSPNIWMDKRDLDPNVNFDNEIHDQLDSAVLILVASPTYIASDYCEKERKAFLKVTGTKHKARFRQNDLANANFIFKVVSLRDEAESHRGILPGLKLSDVEFCVKGGSCRRIVGLHAEGMPFSVPVVIGCEFQPWSQ